MLNRSILSATWLLFLLILGGHEQVHSASLARFSDWASASPPVDISFESILEQAIKADVPVPLAIQINNEGLTEVEYHFVFEQSGGYSPEKRFHHSVSLRVPAKTKIRHEVTGLTLLPEGYNIKVSVTGSYLEGRAGSAFLSSNGRYGHAGSKGSLGIEQSLLEDAPSNWKKVFGEDPSGSTSRDYLLQGVDFSSMPSNPLWLNHLDRVVVSVRTWNELSSDERHGVLNWVFRGGHLIFMGEQGALKDVSFKGDFLKTPYGLGYVQLHEEGFNDKLSSDLRTPLVRRIASLDSASLDEKANSEGLAYGKSRGTNWWIFLGVLPVYAIAAGPGMLVKFAPRGRRSRIFWMVPALALAASLVAAVLIVVGDGFGAKGKRFSIILHDSTTQKAKLNQAQVSRSGLLLSKGFETPSDVYVTSSKSSMMNSSENANRLKYSGDYFKSRSEDTLSLSRYYTKRGGYRLGTDGTLVSSSADHVKVGFVLKGNSIWKIENLRPGEKGKLQPAAIGHLKELSFASSGELKKLAEETPEKVFFIAQLERTEDLVPTLESIRWESDSTLYLTQWNQ